MSATVLTLVLGIAGSLIAGYLMGWRWTERRYKRKHEPAALVFHRKLGKVIEEAERTRGRNALIKARAIVELRDSYRKSLTVISQHLNGQIDSLGRVLEALVRDPGNAAIADEVGMIVRVLGTTWPEKEAIIEVELRKLLAEEGLVED